MRIRFQIGVCLWLALAITASVSPVQAQGATVQRGGGLFGATRSDTAVGNLFDVTLSLSEAYDSEVPAEFRSRIPQSGPQSGGFSTMATLLANYKNTGRRGYVIGTAQTAFRHYEQVGETTPVSHNAAIGGQLELSRTATLRINQSAAYSPSYLHQLFPGTTPAAPGDALAAAPEYRIYETDSYAYATSLEYSVGTRRGNRFAASADFNHTDFRGQIRQRNDLTWYSGRAKYSRGLSRNVGVSAEYEYRTGDFGYGTTGEHRLNIRGDYSRPLSSSRRANFRYRITPSTLVIPESGLTGAVTGRIFRLQAEGSVEYQFRRTWRAAGTYRRGIEYVAILEEPVFADSATAELSGLITRRIDVSAYAGYANGESAITRGRNKLDTYTGRAMVRFALTRSVALHSEYVYYYYDLRGQAGLAPGLPRTYEQHGIRAGVMLWVPVHR